MNWRWASLTAIVAAFVIGYGAFHRRGDSTTVGDAAPPQPGYYLNDAVITQTRKDGTVSARLVAQHIEQRPSDDAIAMSDVRVHYFQTPQEKEWILTAKNGLVPAESSTIQFTGDVELRPSDVPQAFLRTDALAIDAERNVARAIERPTTVKFAGHRLTVQDFTADLATEKLTMESVRGSYLSP